MRSYTEAPGLLDAARSLIKEHHQHLEKPELRLLYRFCDKTDKQRGRTLFGKVKILSDLERHFIEGPAGFDPPDEDGETSKSNIVYIAIIVSKVRWVVTKEKHLPAFVDDLLSQIEIDYDKRGQMKVKISDADSFSVNPRVTARHPDYGNAVIDHLQNAIIERGGQLLFSSIDDPEENLSEEDVDEEALEMTVWTRSQET